MIRPMQLQLGPFLLDGQARRLSRAGQPLALQPKTLELLLCLAATPGKAVSRDELLEAVWPGVHVGDQSLTQAVRRARAAIEEDPDDPRRLVTVPRYGYRLVPDPPSPPIPSTTHGFVGRAPEHAELARLLASRRLITVLGPAGIGKSRLVAEAMRAPEVTGALRVRQVSLEDAVDALGLLAAVAQGLGVPLPAGHEDAQTRIGAALAASGESILVLDGWEHLAEHSAVLSRWSTRAPGLRLLLTSQVRVGLPEEAVLSLGPLPIEQAVTLLRARAGMANLDATTALRGLAERLEGNPLAIELASVRLALLPPGDIAARWDEGLGVLRRGPGRHDSLEAAIDWSVSLLTAGQAEALCHLALLCGLFSADLALGLLQRSSDALDTLQALVDRHLVQRHPAGLRLPESVRAYALARLRERGDEDAARRRLCAALLDDGERRVALFGRERGADDAVAERLSDLLAAHGWALSRDAALASRIARLLIAVLELRGPRSLELEVVQATLAVPQPPATAAALLYQSARLKRLFAQDPLPDIERALALPAVEGELWGRLALLRAVGIAQAGRRREAIAALEALAPTFAPGGPVWTAWQVEMAELQRQEGHLTACIAGLRTAAASRDLGRESYAALTNLAAALHVAGEAAEAELCYREAIARGERQGRQVEASRAHANLVALWIDGGRHDEADAAMPDVLARLRALGDELLELRALTNHASSRILRGQYIQAEADLWEVVTRAPTGPSRPAAELNLGLSSLCRGRADLARLHLDRALAAASPGWELRGFTLAWSAVALARLGRPEDAAAAMTEAERAPIGHTADGEVRWLARGSVALAAADAGAAEALRQRIDSADHRRSDVALLCRILARP
jgi:DNA-binding winged helix-turn-helix (wHTH) protein/predicted ATPase